MITLQEIIQATGGNCEFAGNPEFTGINTDTRTIKKGELFIALKGETFDGHAYAAKAVENGAAGILEICMVPEVGLEPTRCCHRRILSPLRLPIPPFRHREHALQKKR